MTHLSGRPINTPFQGYRGFNNPWGSVAFTPNPDVAHMNIIDQVENGIVVITIAGRLDASSVGSFKAKIKAHLDALRTRFVIDVSEVSFMDSSGLGALVVALQQSGQLGGDVKIAGPTPEVKSLFALTRLNKVFEIHESVQATLASYAQNS